MRLKLTEYRPNAKLIARILSDDIRRVLISLYRVVCKVTNDETADKATQYIMALIGSGVIKKDYEQLMQRAGAENGN